MASLTARIVFTCLVVAAAAAASGQIQHDRAEPVVARGGNAVLLASAADTSGIAAGHGSKQLLIASNVSPAALSLPAVMSRHELKNLPVESEIKEWMLIAMGVFLICAISHRRSRSMAD
jgi:hypothetical protein